MEDIRNIISSNQNPLNMKVYEKVEKMTFSQKQDYLKVYYYNVYKYCDNNNDTDLSITLYNIFYQIDIFEN